MSNSKSEEHRCEECNSVCQNCNTAPEPPQDTSLKDKLADSEPKASAAPTIIADTSLDDLEIPDDIEQLCTYLFEQVQCYRTVEGWDGMVKIKDRVLAWHKQQQIKLIERIEGEVNSEYELSIADLELRQHQQGVEIPVLGKTELLETLKQIKERYE